MYFFPSIFFHFSLFCFSFISFFIFLSLYTFRSSIYHSSLDYCIFIFCFGFVMQMDSDEDQENQQQQMLSLIEAKLEKNKLNKLKQYMLTLAPEQEESRAFIKTAFEHIYVLIEDAKSRSMFLFFLLLLIFLFYYHTHILFYTNHISTFPFI